VRNGAGLLRSAGCAGYAGRVAGAVAALGRVRRACRADFLAPAPDLAGCRGLCPWAGAAGLAGRGGSVAVAHRGWWLRKVAAVPRSVGVWGEAARPAAAGAGRPRHLGLAAVSGDGMWLCRWVLVAGCRTQRCRSALPGACSMH
jgi:hypothetical protein